MPFATIDVLAIGMTGADVLIRPVDHLPPAQGLQLIQDLVFATGGVASTFARDCARLGLSVSLAGSVGKDAFGRLVIQEMQSDGIGLEYFLQHEDLPTASTVVLVDSAGERSFLHRPGAADRLVDVAEIDVRAYRHIHLGGMPLIPGYDGNKGLDLFRRAHEAGVSTSIDTVFSPLDRWSATREVLPETDIAMPSHTEAVRLTGEEEPLRQAAYLVDCGVKIAAIKLGEQGAIFLAEGQRPFQAIPPRTAVVDTTGAGEAFCAGFMYAWLTGWDLTASAEFAVMCGSYATQTLGGPTAMRPANQMMILAQDWKPIIKYL
ncbi:MAG: carbohydrate kinase family protein [Bacilli bacterium]